MEYQEKYEDLYEKIVQWGIDRKILINGKVTGQLKKTFEEAREGLDAFLDGDVDAEKDAIGDVMVTLIMANHLLYLESLELLDHTVPYKVTWLCLSQNISSLIAHVSNYEGELNADSRVYGAKSSSTLGDLVGIMSKVVQGIAEKHGYDFVECLELAYNEIKDRKGYLNAEGVFVKEV